jgi:hypothetical protein
MLNERTQAKARKLHYKPTSKERQVADAAGWIGRREREKEERGDRRRKASP